MESQNNEEDDNQQNNPLLLQPSNSINSELFPKRNRLSKVERLKLFSSIPLDQDPPLNDIIIGLLLGDGHIERRSKSGNSRFIYGQSSLRLHHLNYFLHVFKLFKPYISENFILKERKFRDKRTKVQYSSVNFQTLSLPCFNYYRSIFYDSNNKPSKIVPSNIKDLLTPIGLAYWIMDDGSIQNKGLHLNTYGFTPEDTLSLKITLENMFGENSMKCSIHKHKKGNRIYIWEESMECLRKNITQFMHKDMIYKLSINLSDTVIVVEDQDTAKN